MPGKAKIAAVTHARKDNFFLGLWLKHYGTELGYENCHILLDGSDWTPDINFGDAVTHIVERPNQNMHRIRVDRRMARLQLELIDHLFFEQGYDYVFRGDCDEYVISEPESGTSFKDLVTEADAVGYVYSSGVDVIQNTKYENDLVPTKSILSQRSYGLISQSYCKVNLLSRKARVDGITFNAGGHRASGNAVKMSHNYYMFHLGWSDMKLLRQRISPRFENDRGNSFSDYLNTRQAIFAAVADQPDFADFDEHMKIARLEIATRSGHPALQAQKLSAGNFFWADQHGWAVHIPKRFNESLPLNAEE